VVATIAAYSGVQECGFVNFDDPLYVVNNRHVAQGLTPATVAWAFRSTDDFWFPLTRLSHLTDRQLYDLNAAGHHWTSVAIHALSAVLLFLLLQRMTGSVWKSAFVAAMFALHPLHVESVAWISERKDVLSTFFWIVTIFAYMRYVEDRRPARYALLIASFVLGLMSKPMIVTLPFALLLLDFWPLNRVNLKDRAGLVKLIVEKTPLFGLAIAGSVLTYLVQVEVGATTAVHAPVWLRIQNTLVSYAGYLSQTIWPAGMAVLYPLPLSIPIWKSALAAVALAAVTIFAIRTVRRFPFLAVGWFWFLGTLVPAIGLVQVGFQARADRYTYIPMIGIGIMIAWGAAELFRRHTTALAIAAGIAILAWLLVTRSQVETWIDSRTLFTHAISVTTDNYVAHSNLCSLNARENRIPEALPHCQAAIRIKPDYSDAHTNLADIYRLQGRLDDSIAESREAIRLNPRDATPLANLANLLGYQGKLEESAGKYREALHVSPAHVVARVGLAWTLAQLDRRDEALALLQETVRIHPDYAAAHAQLGILLGSLGRPQEALDALTESIRLNPNDASAHYNLGVTLSAQGRFGEAIGEFQRSLALNPRDAEAYVELGSGLASLGRFSEAIANFQKALELNPDHRRALASLEQTMRLQQQPRP
jgi:tetratricopeptide (TPR) repeat protein